MFHSQIIHDTKLGNRDMKSFKPISTVSVVSQQHVMDNFFQIKYDVRSLIVKEVIRILAEKAKGEKANAI